MKKIIFSVFLLLLSCNVCFSETSQILDMSDRALYQEIFSLQRQSKFYKADLKIKKLNDDILLSYVYAERYLHKDYRSKSAELNAWLKKNPLHVDALRVYNLSVKKKGNPPVRKPQKGLSRPKGSACHIADSKDPVDLLYKRGFSHPNKEDRKKATSLMRKIYRALKRGKTLIARNYVESKDAKRLFSSIDYDSALTALAFAYYIDGRDDLAKDYVKKAINRSGKRIILSHWVYGLINFRNENYEEAYKAFKTVALSKTKYEGLTSAGAFFTSRAALKTGRYEEVNEFLKIASKNYLSFYGVIAKRALGHEKDINYYSEEEKEIQEYNGNFDIPEARQILALFEVGEKDIAEKQFKHLFYNGNAEMKELLIMFANENGKEDLAELVTLERGKLNLNTKRNTYYPVPKWQPQTGWQVDRALVYAFMRQESCFNQKAKSNAGARGLMQIMPATAAILAKDMRIKDWSRSKLFDPEINITLGQKYIRKLMDLEYVNRNLFFTAIAYNAGPGNLLKWVRRKNYNDDPLLFIESIPSRETRDFIKKVMSNFWVYRSLLNKNNPSLDEVVSGLWPIYTDLDGDE
ncbi:MAG: Soluble lytic murein transglycosylase precursor [Alphaproteobacteria bacterium ADurb.Bin438]|nr:MAG: Soluble lytic murein transglycosylase precursor [Alphaproteobacteria bacterium ADurb.Bin438]